MSGFNKMPSVAAANKVPAAVSKIVNAMPDTHNLAGGQAFKNTPQFTLASMLVTSFMEDQYYRSKAQTVIDLQNAISAVDPLFAAKAIIYARTKYGMRSVSHVGAAYIAKKVKGESWTKRFFDKVVYRVDDAAEILAAYIYLHKKPIPNCLKKGLGLSMSKFDAYQLAKYKGTKDAVKLVDLFNLVHPKPNEKNAEAFKQLIEGNLGAANTWEAKMSAAGQAAKDEEEAEQLKTDAWDELLKTNKLGYFALLRNLKNIVGTGKSELIDLACQRLTNREAIKKSLVLPFRFSTAAAQFTGHTSADRQVLTAINDAVTLSLDNVPKFGGKTLVAMDASGSMLGKPAEIGSLSAAVLAKSNNADVILFDGSARYLGMNLADSLLTIRNTICMACRGGSTNFNSIFTTANERYDRIIILSDMQAWVDYNTPASSYAAYCKRFEATPNVYCFDLAGYGTTQFTTSAPNVYQLAGFSDKTMELLQSLEVSPTALIDEINKIEI